MRLWVVGCGCRAKRLYRPVRVHYPALRLPLVLTSTPPTPPRIRKLGGRGLRAAQPRLASAPGIECWPRPVW